jgi:hypothetical protein
MQFNNKITIRIADAFDDYGEPNSYTSHVIKCAILNHVKFNRAEEKKKRNQYDIVIICTARTYEPYSQLFEDSTLEFLYGDKIYEPAKINQISNFSGKPKYYEIGLKQKTKGDIVIEAAV